MNNINIGDIVYWVNRNGGNFSVKFGIVDAIYPGIICVDFLSAKETRLVDGIPIEDFQSEVRWRKLPKGWTYNTELFKITCRDPPEFLKQAHINNPEEIKEAYNRGDLVKDSTLFWGNIETEIDKNAGFRVIKKYPMWEHHTNGTTLNADQVYVDYESARKLADDLKKEFERQCNLTDKEWSIEQIEKDICRWKTLYAISDEDVNKIRAFFATLKNIEDVETRIFGGLQWKYWKNRKWNYLNPDDLGNDDYEEWLAFMKNVKQSGT